MAESPGLFDWKHVLVFEVGAVSRLPPSNVEAVRAVLQLYPVDDMTTEAAPAE
ncbi:hypothetical protein G3N96_21540 [Burkholderia sp. Se-20373]|uniref:hypothetical protein n=1 Tax=Burkholderia sp. Se-20373 TaxID=2703898 RepID=UPI00198088C7|nr:hypothetical protein [Burkholderia sp. Se-20373]MBN3747984.1 hypothetical protein [Burkholderia sp. Se-20373]